MDAQVMDSQGRDLHEQRILERAEQIWQGSGRPDGGFDRYRDAASHLVAIEESFETALSPFADFLMKPAHDEAPDDIPAQFAAEVAAKVPPSPTGRRRRNGALD